MLHPLQPSIILVKQVRTVAHTPPLPSFPLAQQEHMYYNRPTGQHRPRVEHRGRWSMAPTITVIHIPTPITIIPTAAVPPRLPLPLLPHTPAISCHFCHFLPLPDPPNPLESR